MAGPTPVSALIHAATMVTAGVYMVARSAPIYVHAPVALDVVAIIGLATAFFAATIGLAQNDIKKVFAYSTVSQLGYMFLGVGAGAFSAGIFHLVTHAFFKALLFLGAGSVIHALSGEQDLRKMGGLRKKTPITFWTHAVRRAWPLPACRRSPASSARTRSCWRPTITRRGCTGWACSPPGMTAFYVFRAIFLAFFGEYRGDRAPARIAAGDDGPAGGAGGCSRSAAATLQRSPSCWSRCSRRRKAGPTTSLVYISVAAGLAGICAGVSVVRGQARRWPMPLARQLQAGSTRWSTTSTSWMRSTTPRWCEPLVDGSRAVLWQGVDAGLIDGIGQRRRDARRAASAACCGCCSRATSAATRPGCVLGLRAGDRGLRVPWEGAMNLLDLVLAAAAGGIPARCCCFREEGPRLVRWTALAISLAVFVASLALLVGFDRSAGQFQFETDLPWIAAPDIHYHVGLDGLSLWLVLLSTLCSRRSRADLLALTSQDRVKEFYAFLLLLEFGLMGVFVALDLFLFYVFWEVSLVPMYFLIGIWGHERRIYAAREVLPVHDGRLGADAGGDHLPLQLAPAPSTIRL